MDNETAQNPPGATEPQGAAAPAALPESHDSQLMTGEQKRTLFIVIIVLVVLIAAVVGSILFLLGRPVDDVARIRDIFIIFLAVQSLLMGFALVILMVQLARLINLLQNEIKPILDSTNETVSALRGTTIFLSDNLVQPVVKLNEYLAGLNQLLVVLGLFRKSSHK